MDEVSVALPRGVFDTRQLAAVAATDNLRAVLTAIADAVVIVDSNGIVRYANPAAEALLGGGRQMVGEEFGFPVVEGERTELDVLRAGGQPAVAEMRVVAMEWDGERAYCASLRDVTERKEAEAQRLQLAAEQAARHEAEEAVRARDEFLSVAAHELKTPVTRLRLAVQLATRRVRGSGDLEDVGRRLESLDVETGKLSRLVTQLLDVSRIERGTLPLERQTIDLVQVVRDTVESLQATTVVHTIALSSPERLPAHVDPLRVEQVVANLVDNAIKYSPEGGEIQVRLEDGDPKMVTLSVRDWGVGIPVEHREGIFARFYQAHPGTHMAGLGVGLYVSRQIVSLHGGTIDVEFPEGGGTRFVVTLPR